MKAHPNNFDDPGKFLAVEVRKSFLEARYISSALELTQNKHISEYQTLYALKPLLSKRRLLPEAPLTNAKAKHIIQTDTRVRPTSFCHSLAVI